jgi:hypothetical protein
MADTVVPLREGITPLGEPDADIVRNLEDLLEKARAGQIRALAVCALDRPDRGVWYFKVNAPLGDSLVGLLCRLLHRATCAVDNASTPG